MLRNGVPNAGGGTVAMSIDNSSEKSGCAGRKENSSEKNN